MLSGQKEVFSAVTWKQPHFSPSVDVGPYEGDTLDSIGDYASGEDASMIGEKNEIITALEAFVKLDKASK